MTNLIKWLFEKTKNNKTTAINIGNEKISYKNLYNQIFRTSKILSELIGEDENVLLISDNSLFFIVSYLSIIGSGNVCIPLKADKNINLQIIKEKTNSKSIFIQKKYLALSEHLKFINTLTEKDIQEEKHPNFEFKEYKPNKLASIMFTSGSTSEPKGVMITHRNIISNTEAIIKDLFLTQKDRIMVVLPLYYCFGASLLHTHLRVGGELVINNDFFLPQKIINELVNKECTGIAGVPTTFQMLLRNTKINQTKFPNMRCVQQAGGKLANPYLRELIDIFGYEKVFVMYGQTEATARLSILNPKFLKSKFGSIGKGLYKFKLKILNSKGKPVEVGEEGMLYGVGDNIMPGYYKDEEETKKKIINNMLKTEDIGRKDKDGFIFISGREGDFIKSRGYRISIKYIEAIISEIPEIVEVAVVGIEDNILGEKIIAYVSTNKEIDQKKVLNYCMKKLQNHEVPSEIIILPNLPKNQSLKLDYTKLKKEYFLLKK